MDNNKKKRIAYAKNNNQAGPTKKHTMAQKVALAKVGNQVSTKRQKFSSQQVNKVLAQQKQARGESLFGPR